MAAKKPPAKVKPKVKSAPKAVKTAAMKKAMANPAKFAGSAKVKTVPYSKMKVRKRSTLDKVAEGVLSNFGPLYAIERAVSTIVGKDLNSNPYDKSGKWVGYKKQGRLGGALDVALAAAPLKGAKKAKQAIKGLSAIERQIGKSTRRGTGATVASKSKVVSVKSKKR